MDIIVESKARPGALRMPVVMTLEHKLIFECTGAIHAFIPFFRLSGNLISDQSFADLGGCATLTLIYSSCRPILSA